VQTYSDRRVLTKHCVGLSTVCWELYGGHSGGDGKYRASLVQSAGLNNKSVQSYLRVCVVKLGVLWELLYAHGNV